MVRAAAVLAAAGAAALAASAQAAGTDVTRSYHTRPDLRPPVVQVVTRRANGRGTGLIALAPKNVGTLGPMLMDDRGRMVWFHPVPTGQIAADFRVQRYRGRPVLTWWQGTFVPPGSGSGEGVIYDASYHLIARVRAGGGGPLDLHEFRLTRRGTAWVTIYQPVPTDLSSVGGPSNGVVVDCIVEEVDVATGKVRFKWHSLGHVGLDESYVPVPHDSTPFDYFHLNSVDEQSNGNLIVSGRDTSAAYEVDRKTGRVLWRLGGRRSDFTMGPGAGFFFQHDVRRRADGTITMFDNGSAQSRALRLALDLRTRSARLVREARLPGNPFAFSQGNVQTEPGGGLLVGWGSFGSISEFDSANRVVFDAVLPPKEDTYRAYRVSWTGNPTTRPAVAARANPHSTTVWASWNGATAVAAWRALAGPDRAHLAAARRTVPWRSFETRLHVRRDARYVAVQALDAQGKVMGRSRAVKVAGGG